MLRYMIDRARPGLVGFYDIWPGNAAGLFLQPRSPHRAVLVGCAVWLTATDLHNHGKLAGNWTDMPTVAAMQNYHCIIVLIHS